MFLVEVDGVRILHCGDLGQAKLTKEQLKTIGEIDVLLIPVGGVVYLVVLALVGGFRQPDMYLLGRLLPVARLKARFSSHR